MFEMDKCREEFQKAFPVPAHWIEFDEKANRYYCPYVADSTASTYQSKWVVWQHQQAKVEELEGKLKQSYEDVDTFAEAHERECGFKAQLAKDKAELQKRVDAVKGLAQNLWEKSNEKHEQGKVWESKALGECADEILDVLEQALKGEG